MDPQKDIGGSRQEFRSSVLRSEYINGRFREHGNDGNAVIIDVKLQRGTTRHIDLRGLVNVY